MAVNVELLNKTLELIKVKPEEYNQGSWVDTDNYSPCGTTMCFAGHAAVLAGAEIPDPKKHFVSDWYVKKDESNSYLNYEDTCELNYGEYQHVQYFAQDALGITFDEQDYLFHSDRTVEQIEVAVHELTTTGSILTWDSYDEDEYDEDDDYEYGCDCGECT